MDRQRVARNGALLRAVQENCEPVRRRFWSDTGPRDYFIEDGVLVWKASSRHVEMCTRNEGTGTYSRDLEGIE